jgi:hypothetical protein
MEEVKKDHAKYFEALDKHPRQLVGEKVPDLRPGKGPEDFETLKDSADAAEWQEMVKRILVDEIKDKATKALEANSSAHTVTQQAIAIFQNNKDLVPKTKEFDKELADEFIKIAGSYALKDDKGKTLGFSIPVQPIIDQVRASLQARRAAAPPATGETPPATPPAPGEPPQQGIPSKPGAAADQNTFVSDLFGTLGEEYRNIRI